jgi:hypothetical protein
MTEHLFAPEALASRPPVTEPIKQAIRDAFLIVPPGRSSAVLAIADEHGARIHAAVKLGGHWEVGGQIGIPIDGKPSGWVGVLASW